MRISRFKAQQRAKYSSRLTVSQLKGVSDTISNWFENHRPQRTQISTVTNVPFSSKLDSDGLQVDTFCSYHILTSSVIYYWTDARQHGIYLLTILYYNAPSGYTKESWSHGIDSNIYTKRKRTFMAESQCNELDCLSVVIAWTSIPLFYAT